MEWSIPEPVKMATIQSIVDRIGQDSIMLYQTLSHFLESTAAIVSGTLWTVLGATIFQPSIPLLVKESQLGERHIHNMLGEFHFPSCLIYYGMEYTRILGYGNLILFYSISLMDNASWAHRKAMAGLTSPRKATTIPKANTRRRLVMALILFLKKVGHQLVHQDANNAQHGTTNEAKQRSEEVWIGCHMLSLFTMEWSIPQGQEMATIQQ
jgi:hypothetical protein